MFKFLYFSCVALRIILAPLIFLFPIPIIFILFFLDAIDVEFASRKVLTLNQYEKYDKALDLWWYINALVYSYFYLNTYFIFLFILFIYRLVGDILFFSKGQRKILVFFPNFFENVFFLVFFSLHFNQLSFLLNGINFYIALFFVCLIKIIQEWWVHFAQISIPEDIFKKKRTWLQEK